MAGVMIFVATFLLAWATYLLVEQPLRESSASAWQVFRRGPPDPGRNDGGRGSADRLRGAGGVAALVDRLSRTTGRYYAPKGHRRSNPSGSVRASV